MNDASETNDAVWHVDPVAGTVTGALPVVLPINRFADLPLDAVAALPEACRRQFGRPEDRAGRVD